MVDVPETYRPMIGNAARRHSVPAVMLACLLYQESGFDPNARSVNKDGSVDRGIAQINDRAHPDVTDQQAYDPAFAIDWCAAELRSLRDSGCVNWYETLLAYNGGMGAVYAYREGRGYNIQYATDIFILSQLNLMAEKCEQAVTLCSELWDMDLFNRDLYHEIANWLRQTMGWPTQSPPAPPVPPYRFGRKPYVPDSRDLVYAKYRATQMPPYPKKFGHQGMIPWNAWGMLGNDKVGDCTCAAADHETVLWTAEGAGVAARFVPANTLSDYSAITGYNPANPASDTGAAIRDVLKYRQKVGMLDINSQRHKIGAYLALDTSQLDEILEAAYLFSACEVGVIITEAAMAQFQNDTPWEPTANDGKVLGRHDVPIVGWDGTYLYCVTWGGIQEITPGWMAKYCEEAWAILSPEMLNGQGKSPEGLDLAQLQADLAAITDYTPPAPGPQTVTVTITAKNRDYTVDGQAVTADTSPVLLDPPGHLFVPVRTMGDIIDAVAAKLNVPLALSVSWDEGAEMATLTFVPK